MGRKTKNSPSGNRDKEGWQSEKMHSRGGGRKSERKKTSRWGWQWEGTYGTEKTVCPRTMPGMIFCSGEEKNIPLGMAVGGDIRN